MEKIKREFPDADLSTRAALDIIKERLTIATRHSFGIRHNDLTAPPEQEGQLRLHYDVEWVRSRTVSCLLYTGLHVDLDYVTATYERWKALDLEGIVTATDTMPIRYRLHSQIRWTNETRSIAEATASIALYREVVLIAADLEAALGEDTIGKNFARGER